MPRTQIPIFAINLDRSSDRLALLSDRLTKLGLTFERIPAIDGMILTEAEKQKLNPKRFWVNPFTNSEIAVYSSHLKAIRIISDRNIAKAIILEDDAIFDEDFPKWADTDCPLPAGAGILKLEGFGAKTGIRIPISTYENRKINFAYRPSGGAAAYIITLTGANKLLKKLDVMSGQIDEDLFAYWKTGLQVYEVLPSPARQGGLPSTIDHTPKKRSLTLSISRYFLKSYYRLVRLYFVARNLGATSAFFVLYTASQRGIEKASSDIQGIARRFPIGQRS